MRVLQQFPTLCLKTLNIYNYLTEQSRICILNNTLNSPVEDLYKLGFM